MCKVSRGLSPEIVNELFQFSKQILYKLRKKYPVSNSLGSFKVLNFLGQRYGHWCLINETESQGKFRNVIKQ